MRIVDRGTIRRAVRPGALIDLMRDALVARARGACETPMPIHLDVPPADGGDGEAGEIHIKAGLRRGGRYWAVKTASGFPANAARGLPTGHGLILLGSAETGAPVALLDDGGDLTDLRTAAVTALAARELGRRDEVLGILGTGVQARLQALLHREVLPLREIVLWGRTPERAARCAADLRSAHPGLEVSLAATPEETARRCRLIVTATASREPLLFGDEVEDGTHVSAVGADGPGKRELGIGMLERAGLLLCDSREQALALGELQHDPREGERAVELGEFCLAPVPFDRGGITVCDFTGLGVEDLYIAEHVWDAVRAEAGA